MPISPQLMQAILAMDSYNQGYSPGITDVGLDVGEASVIDAGSLGVDAVKLQEWQSAGFYALAYDWNGQTVISYRGTDGFLVDGPNGYGIGLGSAANSGVYS